MSTTVKLGEGRECVTLGDMCLFAIFEQCSPFLFGERESPCQDGPWAGNKHPISNIASCQPPILNIIPLPLPRVLVHEALKFMYVHYCKPAYLYRSPLRHQSHQPAIQPSPQPAEPGRRLLVFRIFTRFQKAGEAFLNLTGPLAGHAAAASRVKPCLTSRLASPRLSPVTPNPNPVSLVSGLVSSRGNGDGERSPFLF